MTVSPMLSRSLSRSPAYHTAIQALSNGFSVVPMRVDGTKQPALSGWREYQKQPASRVEVERWFGRGAFGIALVTGAVSGNLEALDFDDDRIFERWLRHVRREPALAALYDHVSQGYLEVTPSGGRHLLYCCAGVESNQKLASLPDGARRKTLIETRGEGGLIIIAPSCGLVHPSGRPYRLLRGGVSSIRTITPRQRALLLSTTREFNEVPSVDRFFVPSEKQLAIDRQTEGLRPGDLFNQRAHWEDVLLPHGWQLVRSLDGEGYWRRPGKQGPGISATTNYLRYDLLYVFSTSTIFEAERGYTKFKAYTLLNHQGNFSAAARELAELGYAM